MIDLGKENLDIEIEGSNYRLSGEISNGGFVAYASQTMRIGVDSVPISMAYRRKLASHMDKSTFEEVMLWLNDPTISINTNLVEIEDNEKEVIMKRICKEWKDINVSIFFIDEKGKFLCRTRPEIGKSRDAGVKFDILNIQKGKLDIELDGRIARFGGEMWTYGFTVNIRQMECLSPKECTATYEETMIFIKELNKLYRKEPRKNRRKFQLMFYEMRDGKWHKVKV